MLLNLTLYDKVRLQKMTKSDFKKAEEHAIIMFEGLVASILNRYLSDYIDEVDYNNLKLGIFSGTLELLNIKIKPSAMYQFDLPVDVKSGTIGKLKINISWRNILTKPAVAILEDLFVLLGPFEEKINDPKRIEELSLAHKRKQLQEFEKLDKREIVESKEKGYAEKVQDTIINNIQVYVKNVHIRYEDKHSLKNKNVSFGLYLKEFKAETVDEDGKPNFMNADAKIIFKLGSLNGFNMYWNCDFGDHKDLFISTRDEFDPKKNDWVDKMKSSIESNQILNSKFENFMENNLVLDMRLTIRRTYDKENLALPKITFQSSVNAIEFVFQRIQYKSILELVDHYTMLNQHKKYVKFRPKEVNDKRLKIKQWWNYAFTSLAETSWRSYRKERISQSFKNYKLYMKKYEQKLLAQIKGKTLDQKDLDLLAMLEKELILESIFDIRNMLMDKYKLNQTTVETEKTQKADAFDRPLNYVQFRLILNFPLISLKLKNSGVEILRLNLKSIISRLEVKPVQNSVYFLLNTRGVDLYGIHYKNNFKSDFSQLVPIVKSTQDDSDIDQQATVLASENADDMLLIFCFETNPVKYENSEFSIRSKVSSVEIYYEKTAITELLRFFRTDLIDFGEVKKIKEVWSKAGVIYAVENHKQFHIKAELASPYFIIPVKGTYTEPGDSIIFFLGKTLIQSQVQPKLTNYTPESIEDLEKKFYDKLSMSISDVQVLLIPDGIDWKNYLMDYVKLNYLHHLLYPVSTQNNLYLSINPSYKKLPKLKLEADISSIKLNFSSDKITKILEFGKNFPLPDVPKSAVVITPVTQTQTNNKKIENKKLDKPDGNSNLFNLKTTGDEIEPDDEWNGPFNLPKYINGDPIPNYSQITCRFNIADFSIDLNQGEIEYLKFIFNSIKIDFVIAKYGVFFRAGLGDLKLIDKIHESVSTGESYTEILSSSSRGGEIIRFNFRQVDQDAPNFSSLYSKILTNILFDCSNIHVKCHRAAIVYFLNFFKSITDKLDSQPNVPIEPKNDESTQKEDLVVIEYPDDVVEFNLIAKMNELTWNMFDTNVNFGNMIVKELSVSYNLNGPRTELTAQLRKILINYGDSTGQMSEYYRQIISCTGDGSNRQFFDFKVQLYDRRKVTNYDFKDQLKLNIGKIKVICLVKFVNELVDFMDPIVNPLPSGLTEQVKEQAYEAVKNAYQETKSEKGNRIYLDIHITSPQVIIPQNSHCLSGFLVDLGTLNVTNEFLDEGDRDQVSCIQKFNIELLNLEIKRINYKPGVNYFCEYKEQVMNPISLNCKALMPVINLEPDKYADLDIYVQLNDVELMVSKKTAKLLFAILDENLNEGIKSREEMAPKEVVKKIDDKKDDKPVRDRINFKMYLDLNQIKLIIIELKQVPKQISSGESKRNLDVLSSGSKDDYSVYLSVKSQSAIQSNVDSDVSSKSTWSKTMSNRSFFSHFEIQSIKFKFVKNENTSWRADLNMRSLVLNDVRPDSNLAVKEMFVSSKEKDFIQITYLVNSIGQAKLDFLLDNLKINLCLPYVLRLYQIAMEAISSDKKPQPAQVKKNSNQTPHQEAQVQNTSLVVNGKVNLNEVVLYAQPEKLNSKILVMDALVLIKFESINNKSSLEIELIRLGLRLGEHNSNRKGIPFLTPCSAKVTMKQDDPTKPAQYKAQIDSLYFNMTRSLYEVVIGVVTSINQTGTEIIKKQIEERQLLENAEPFVKHRVDPSEYDSVKKPDNTDTISQIVDNEEITTKVSEILDLKINQAFINFCEESNDLQPLAIVKIQLEGKIANWSKNLHCKASLALEASYYNDILSNWEPLVENIMQKEDDYRPWILSLWFAMEPGGILQTGLESQTIEFPVKDLDYSEVEVKVEQRAIDVSSLTEPIVLEEEPKKQKKFKKIKDNDDEVDIEPEVDKTVKASYVLIESNDLLNLNLTPSAYKVIIYLASITSGSDKEFMESKEKPPLKFLNFLGENCELTLSPKNYLKPENAIGFKIKFSSTKSLNEGQEEEEGHDEIQRIVNNSQRSQIDTTYNDNYKFIFSLAHFERCKLGMKNDGSYIFSLRSSSNNQDLNEDNLLLKSNIKYNVMYKVRTLYGRRKIIFSSPLQIENYTQINLYIWVEMTPILGQNEHKFKFLSKVETDGKIYAAIFRLIPDKIFYVPLYFAYNCKLYVSPDNGLFAPSQIFDLRGYNLRVEDYSDVTCKRLHQAEHDFNLFRKLSLNVRSHRNVMPAMHANYKVCLYTPIKLINSLPFQIRIDIDRDGEVLFNPTLEPGDSLNLNLRPESLSSCKIHLINYLNVSWLGLVNLNKLIETKDEVLKIEMNVAPTNEMEVRSKHPSVSVSYKQPNEFMFYCPYWLINKSGQPITIKTVESKPRYFDIPDDSILLFDYRYIDKDNKVRLTTKNGGFSDSFSLETVGTTGMIQCSDGRRVYNFLMRITMSNSSRTKLITFAPFLSVANHLDEPLQIRESYRNEKSNSKHNWVQVDKTTDNNKPVALWPETPGDNRPVMFVIRTNDNKETQPFILENPGRFVLMPKSTTNDESITPNNILTVLISGGSTNPVTIVVRKYQYGDSVAKFLNLCDDIHISLYNKNSTWNIEPFTSMFFTWPDLQTRELKWSVNTCDKKEALNLTKSGNEIFKFLIEKKENSILNNSDTDHENDQSKTLIKNKKLDLKEIEVSCVSYLEDGQRVILFTTDPSLAEIERTKEASNMEIFVNFRGVQLSVVNNVNLEVSTISIKESKSSWEIVSESTVRIFTKDYSEWLESLYAKYLFNLHSVESLRVNSNLHLFNGEYNDERFEINFKLMKIMRPEIGRLKRRYYPGLVVQYRTSTNMMSLKCSVYKIQIDNQLPDAYFPIVFHKTPTRIIDEADIVLPFFNLSLFTEQQNVTQIYRNFECVLQEFYLKADKGFILSMKDWYDAAIMTSSREDKSFDLSDENCMDVPNVLILVDEDKSMLEKMKMDIKLTKEIMEYKNPTGAIKQSAHIRFEIFKLSPIVFNLSFSVNGEAHTDDKIVSSAASDYIFNFFLESIGASLTEFKDVKFTFNKFEMENETKTWKEMYDVLFDHYKIQALHQAYVLILGLDVLGNPFGLVNDFSEGFTSLFYDPLVDYIFEKKGGENRVNLEFATKVRLTINKTISSAAGSGSLITGSIGRVLATFTFDKDYKKKRQYIISKLSTSTLTDTVSSASKGIVRGLIYGLTGVVNKPIDEGKKGTKGVFVGMGKGFVGLFAKPVGSIFDGVSLTLDGIKRFAQSAEPITNVRLPRHLINDVSILPYSEYQAEGYEILRDLQNDDIALDEFYWAHLFIVNKYVKSTLLFITDTNIYRLKRTSTQILKQWKIMGEHLPLHKIKNVQFIPFDIQKLKNHNRVTESYIKKKLAPYVMGNDLSKAEVTCLYVVSSDKDVDYYDLKSSGLKNLLLIADMPVCEWLRDKIQSANKYYQELKNFIEIVD
ncbi:unnamed protein product [Brachionus calyciflorus]|uniref:Uncharacterized protein n=1 Tax=Brachionus calyciflorus TaxID=104777 RepID=A0A813M8P1_9BILA|nr:unnamed protein product [Brachionus calyciflorus]